ncbi:MAG TPA: glycoside hydrolase family 3 C-terminal domain-containing protein [Actinomycetes bacterium]
MRATELTLAEQATLTAGRDLWSTQPVERLGVPSAVLTDGPHGVRMRRSTDELELGDAVPATCFPTASALAATWNLALLEQVGVALGEEASAQQVSVLLGPGANIKRTPVCGRNFEYFSEDPLLSSALAAAWISGVQSTGVAASLKHFAANNQESRRYSIDTLVDERALREIYLASFERAVVEARPATVMAAYNQVNGVHASEHRELLTTILRDEWGFDGLVVSDWGAVFDRALAVAAGCDLQMPGFDGQGDAGVVAAVQAGRLAGAALEASAERMLRLIEATAGAREPGHPYDVDAHHALARRASAEGTVLLKNDGGLLPLAPSARVAVVGEFATVPRYQGAGSSLMNPHRVDDAFTAISALVGADRVTYAAGYLRNRDEVQPALLDMARAEARDADVVLAFVGLPEAYETEGVDRAHLRLPDSHDALVRALVEVNPNVVVVLSNGAPVEMPWVAQVPAVVEAYLGGQAGGGAVADVLFGVAEPGGRLAETFPRRWSDNPVSALPTGPRQVEYRESLYVGYRYYDSVAAEVLFPFGHGLGYTTFGYAGLDLGPAQVDDGAELRVTVTVTVTNTGDRAGSEVVQLYVHDVESSVFRPEQELKAFAKVWLAPGESQAVTLDLDRRAFAVWDRQQHGWTVEPGRFEIRVGSSSRDIRARAVLEVASAGVELPPDRPALAPYRDLSMSRGFDRAAFQVLYGSPLPDNVAERRGQYTMDTPLAAMRQSLVARALVQVLRRAATKIVGSDEDGPMALLVDRVVHEMPLRVLPMLSQGKVGSPVATALLAVANGRPLAGAAKVLAALRPLPGRQRAGG